MKHSYPLLVKTILATVLCLALATGAPAQKPDPVPVPTGPQGPPPTMSLKAGQAFPGVSLQDTAGKTVRTADLFSREALLVVYWSVTCDHCVKEVPVLLKDYAAGADPGFRLVLVAGEAPDMVSVAKKFIAGQKVGRARVLWDPTVGQGNPLADAIGLQYTPTLVLVCRGGKVARTWEGAPTKKDLEAALAELKAGKLCPRK